MKNVLTVLLAGILLSGCATREQVAQMHASEDIANYGPRCERLGLKAQTPDWAKCVATYATGGK